MKNSLQDQLLQLGLVNKSKAQQVKKEQRKQARVVTTTTPEETITDVVAKAAADKAARDRELNRQKELKQTVKAHKVLLRQFIEHSRLNDSKADQVYNFVHDSNVRRLYVTAAQRDQLVAGKLAIVQFDERYVLVTLAAAAKISDLSKETFVFTAPPKILPENDPYAEFQVPDDLMW